MARANELAEDDWAKLEDRLREAYDLPSKPLLRPLSQAGEPMTRDFVALEAYVFGAIYAAFSRRRIGW